MLLKEPATISQNPQRAAREAMAAIKSITQNAKTSEMGLRSEDFKQIAFHQQEWAQAMQQSMEQLHEDRKTR